MSYLVIFKGGATTIAASCAMNAIEAARRLYPNCGPYAARPVPATTARAVS